MLTERVPYPNLLGALFLGTLTIGSFFPLTLAGLIPALGLVGTTLFYKACGRLPKIDQNILLGLLILSALLIASAQWSITPEASLERAFKISALLLGSTPLLFLCSALPLQSLHLLKRFAAFPLIITATILFIELKFNYPLYHLIKGLPDDVTIPPSDLNKHVGTLIMLAPFGIIFALRARFLTAALLLTILCGLVLTVTESQAAQLAAFVMLFAMPVLLLMPNAAPILFFGGTAILMIFMPWFAPVAFDALAEPLAQKSNLAHQANMSMRLENWDFLARRIMENPWTGFGVDTTRSMTFDTEQKYFHGNTIVHPHNIALQIWIEFGAIGITLASTALYALYRRLTKLSLSTQIMPFTLLCGCSIFLMVSWSIWASWLNALMIWIAALLILATKPKAAQTTS